jgi:HEAT repeat protein
MDDRTATEAIAALGQLGHSEAAAALIDAASLPARREKCVVALAAMSDAAVPALAQGLRHGELDTRRAIVEALARIRSAAAVDALEIALADREPAVRHAALSALAHLRRVPRTEASAHL